MAKSKRKKSNKNKSRRRKIIKRGLLGLFLVGLFVLAFIGIRYGTVLFRYHSEAKKLVAEGDRKSVV